MAFALGGSHGKTVEFLRDFCGRDAGAEEDSRSAGGFVVCRSNHSFRSLGASRTGASRPSAYARQPAVCRQRPERFDRPGCACGARAAMAGERATRRSLSWHSPRYPAHDRAPHRAAGRRAATAARGGEHLGRRMLRCGNCGGCWSIRERRGSAAWDACSAGMCSCAREGLSNGRTVACPPASNFCMHYIGKS